MVEVNLGVNFEIKKTLLWTTDHSLPDMNSSSCEAFENVGSKEAETPKKYKSE